MRRFPLLLLALAMLAAGCGSDVPNRPADRDAPGLTVGGHSYESGAGDGSGADGTEDKNPRGGVAAGPDTPPPDSQEGGDVQRETR
jgi:hypothetical protein